MDKKTYSNLVVSSAPHLVTSMDTTKICFLLRLEQGQDNDRSHGCIRSDLRTCGHV